MAVNNFYALHHSQLLDGLNNYRQRGYQIALNIGSLYSANGLLDLIAKLAPNYLRLNAPNSETVQNPEVIWPSALKTLVEMQNLIGGQTILQHVEQNEQAFVASSVGFGLVQGGHYDKLVTDHLRCL